MSEISKAREAAVYVLVRCRRFDAWSGQTLQAANDKFGLTERDMALTTRICRTVLQNAARIDATLELYCTLPLRKLQPQVLDILRIGAAQLLFLDRIPASAVVNDAVAQTKKTAPKAAGMVNAVLRRVSENRNRLPELPAKGSAEYLSVLYSHPLWLCETAIDLLGADGAEKWLSANNTEPPMTVTGNPLRGAETSESTELKSEGAVENAAGFSEGRFFVQDAAAAASVRAIGLRPGMRVLDGCAAPGGKSFMAAILMEGRGEIVSCDLHAKKLALIENSANRLGVDIIKTAPMNAAEPYERFYESFDVVMADVPCSGLGVIRRKPEIRYKAPAELERLPELQLSILEGLAKCVKPGGILHYSTCTVLPRENGEVAAAFRKRHDEFVMEEERTFWPHIDGTDGFYYCRMRRNG